MSEPLVTPLGRVQPYYKGTWANNIQYNKLDYVDYNGSSYICKINGVSGADKTPSDSSIYWQLVAHKGDTGTIQNPAISVETLDTGAQASASIASEGPADNRKFTFFFGIPTGPAGPVGIQSIDVSATRENEQGTGNLGPDDDPWATAALDSSTHALTIEFGIPPGHDGAGGVSKVDGKEPYDGNVQINAVRYEAQPSLTASDKLMARLNIEAAPNPTNKQYGQFLQYAGDQNNPDWIASTVLQVPGGGNAGDVLRKQDQAYGWTPTHEIPSGGDIEAILGKQTTADFSCVWINPLSNTEINTIITNN